jgi:hypothetical protein
LTPPSAKDGKHGLPEFSPVDRNILKFKMGNTIEKGF